MNTDTKTLQGAACVRMAGLGCSDLGWHRDSVALWPCWAAGASRLRTPALLSSRGSGFVASRTIVQRGSSLTGGTSWGPETVSRSWRQVTFPQIHSFKRITSWAKISFCFELNIILPWNPWAIARHQEAGRVGHTPIFRPRTEGLFWGCHKHALHNTDNVNNVTHHYSIALIQLSGKNLSNRDKSHYDLFIFQACGDQEI